ncbi:hypothetical protein HG536_0F03330 [Torulaspora globosa]|uniref:Altered inheritance of mitochondria protein 21 n=1 Tax=Torulaspora globosa TaxID=48254 RepID=A0A7G3ZKH2_9SACH|nr:uncharacterized protein HG536_0F03330 [Torulaspora globosa]QLL34008.1 hypothetical protein HG536_0F03330 [Torulaspora globosa]
MSSDDVPRIPERPQRVRGHRLTEEISQEKFPLPSSAEADLAKAEGSELPKIPGHRPQRLKNSSSSPVLPVSKPHESSDLKPSVPGTRPNREKKENMRENGGITKDEGSQSRQESSDHEPTPQLPAARPQRLKSTPATTAVPSTGPLATLKTVASTDEVERSEEPLDQSLKRSTTENLDMLVQNTSEQLKEMEMLLSKREMAPVRGNSLIKPIEVADVSSDRRLMPENPEQKSTGPNDGSKTETQAASKSESDEPQSSAAENDREEVNRELLRETEQSESTAEEHPEEVHVMEATNQGEMKGTQPEREVSPDEEPPTTYSTKAQANLSSLDEQEVAEFTKDFTPAPELDHLSSDKVEETKGGDISSELAPSVFEETEVLSQKSDHSSIPSAKRAAPPVPKKPSSRIAAFQQMLQNQQLEQLQGSIPFRPHESPLSMESGTGGAPNYHRKALNDERAQFGKNLGTLFANPDMVTGSSISTDRRTEGNKLEEPNENSTRTPSESQQRRARGPRGRKLPSLVANVEKVKTENSNDIELFHMWTIVSNNRDDKNTKEVLKDDSGQKSAQLSEGRGAFEILSDGTQERRPSVLEDPSQPMVGSQETVNESEDLAFDETPQKLMTQSAFNSKEVHQVRSSAKQELEENLEETANMKPGHKEAQEQSIDDKNGADYSFDLEQEL